MKRNKGGQRVKAGFYWRPARWEIVPVSGAGGILPGEPTEAFRRIPTLGILMLGPAMGALLVVFLPLVGFVLVGRYLITTPLFDVRRRRAAVKVGSRPA